MIKYQVPWTPYGKWRFRMRDAASMWPGQLNVAGLKVLPPLCLNPDFPFCSGHCLRLSPELPWIVAVTFLLSPPSDLHVSFSQEQSSRMCLLSTPSLSSPSLMISVLSLIELLSLPCEVLPEMNLQNCSQLLKGARPSDYKSRGHFYHGTNSLAWQWCTCRFPLWYYEYLKEWNYLRYLFMFLRPSTVPGIVKV